MAHGYPSGVLRLYTDKGEPVEVALRPDGTYALTVQDDRVRRLLEQILSELRKKE